MITLRKLADWLHDASYMLGGLLVASLCNGDMPPTKEILVVLVVTAASAGYLAGVAEASEKENER